MSGGEWILLIVGCFVGGIIGNFLGGRINRGTLGFWAGFFLGPLGWILIFFAPPVEKRLSDGPRPPKGSEAYNLWLSDKFAIKKNETFGKYECKGSLFDTLEMAIQQAEKLDKESAESEWREMADFAKRQKEIETKPWHYAVVWIFILSAAIFIFWSNLENLWISS